MCSANPLSDANTCYMNHPHPLPRDIRKASYDEDIAHSLALIWADIRSYGVSREALAIVA